MSEKADNIPDWVPPEDREKIKAFREAIKVERNIRSALKKAKMGYGKYQTYYNIIWSDPELQKVSPYMYKAIMREMEADKEYRRMMEQKEAVKEPVRENTMEPSEAAEEPVREKPPYTPPIMERPSPEPVRERSYTPPVREKPPEIVRERTASEDVEKRVIDRIEYETIIQATPIVRKVLLNPEILLWYDYIKSRGYDGDLGDFLADAVRDVFASRGYKIKIAREITRSALDRQQDLQGA